MILEKSQDGPILGHMPTAVARGLGAVTGGPTRTQSSEGAVTQRNKSAFKNKGRGD